MVEEENYITIMGFMVSTLKLKGSELLVYALIYGFSQDNQSKFYGSRRYIAEWFNCSLPTIDKALESLIQKDLIIKETEIINGVIFNRYRCNKETLQGIKKLYSGSKETLHNNNIYNNSKENSIINNTKRTSFIKPTIEEIQEYCYERGNYIDAYTFYDFYESKNWFIGKNKMKDWKAAIRTWEKRDNKKPKILPNWYNKEIENQEIDEESAKEFNNFIEEFRK
jgi:predicted transcriptional regulator